MRRKEMISREQNGENVYWCKGVKGWKNVLKCFWTESGETKPNKSQWPVWVRENISKS